MNLKYLVFSLLLITNSYISAGLTYLDCCLIGYAQNGNKIGAQECIEKGANINSQDVYKSSPLYWAALKGHPEIIEILLKQPGIKVNLDCGDGGTALHAATRTEHKEHLMTMVKLLVEHGATVNPRDNIKYTPLNYVEGRNPEVAAYLQEHGALTDIELDRLRNKTGNYY